MGAPMSAPVTIDMATIVPIGAGDDPRYTFLQRASIRLWMVDNCVMELDEAFSGLVDILQCNCEREMIARWERDYPHKPKRLKQTIIGSNYVERRDY
jgi:hypothetical protein